MVRTRHSMQIIQEILGLTEKNQIEEPLLAEIDCGECTNMDKKIVERDYADALKNRKEDRCSYRHY